MNAIAMIGGWLAATSFYGQVTTDIPREKSEVLTIPLEEIWAYEMPGTRPMIAVNVSPTSSRTEVRLADEILDVIDPKPPKKAKPGFAVAGSDIEALSAAHDVLTKKKLGRSLTTKEDIWIAFFSHNSGRYVHIQRVERQGESIEIRFQFVPHMTKEMTQHFALIPLGKLMRGTYKVDIIQSPMPKKFVDWGIQPVSQEYEARVVCCPFEFEVAEGNGRGS